MVFITLQYSLQDYFLLSNVVGKKSNFPKEVAGKMGVVDGND